MLQEYSVRQLGISLSINVCGRVHRRQPRLVFGHPPPILEILQKSTKKSLFSRDFRLILVVIEDPPK